jgi:hypothetical protein
LLKIALSGREATDMRRPWRRAVDWNARSGFGTRIRDAVRV